MQTITFYVSMLILACLFTFTPYLKKLTEWFIVIIHELGHGFVALLFGGGISGIKLNPDGSGSANTTHRQTSLYKIGRTATLFAGYSFPIYFGGALLISVFLEHAETGIIILISLGVITLFFLRNFFGYIIILTYLLFLILLNFFIPYVDTSYLVAFMGFLFIVRGTVDLIQIGPIVFNKNTKAESDFHILAQESNFISSPTIWFILFIITQISFIFLSYFIAEKLFLQNI
jgi:hypothetical protein